MGALAHVRFVCDAYDVRSFIRERYEASYSPSVVIARSLDLFICECELGFDLIAQANTCNWHMSKSRVIGGGGGGGNNTSLRTRHTIG